MYLPESNAQMFDILTELRLYAQHNALPRLAEELDDALMVLALEGRRNAEGKDPAARAEDAR